MSADSWLEQYQARLEADQADKPREDILRALQDSAEHVFDPTTVIEQHHVWIDRGLKYSCENAGHPYHQAWKKQVKPMA